LCAFASKKFENGDAIPADAPRLPATSERALSSSLKKSSGLDGYSGDVFAAAAPFAHGEIPAAIFSLIAELLRATQHPARVYVHLPLPAFEGRTEKSFDLEPSSADANPSAKSPRFRSSRMADARLGMRREKRQLSTAFSSPAVSMI